MRFARNILKSVAVLGMATAMLGAGCSNEDAPDARPVQSFDGMCVGAACMKPDATPAPDGTPDASTLPDHFGTISIAQVTVPQFGTALGKGGQISIDIEAVTAPPANRLMHVDTHTAGSPTGCTADLYDVSGGKTLPPNVAEGTVTITGTTQAVPVCSFNAGIMAYACLASGGAPVQVTVAVGAMGTALYTISGATFSSADVGRFLKISGSTHAANDGAFPIVAFNPAATDTLIVGNQAAVAEATPYTGGFAVAAGAGPVPGGTDFITPGGKVKVVGAGGANIAFDSGDITVGDDFTYDAAKQAISTVKVDGSAMSFGSVACATCGAVGAVAFTTTDGSVAGIAPFTMPDATGKVAFITCTAFGDVVNVPANISAVLMASGATRIRTTFLRGNPGLLTSTVGNTNNPVNVLISHGQVGFTSP